MTNKNNHLCQCLFSTKLLLVVLGLLSPSQRTKANQNFKNNQKADDLCRLIEKLPEFEQWFLHTEPIAANFRSDSHAVGCLTFCLQFALPTGTSLRYQIGGATICCLRVSNEDGEPEIYPASHSVWGVQGLCLDKGASLSTSDQDLNCYPALEEYHIDYRGKVRMLSGAQAETAGDQMKRGSRLGPAVELIDDINSVVQDTGACP